MGLSLSLSAQEFNGAKSLRIIAEAPPLDFQLSTIKIPEYSLGIEVPKGNFTLSAVGLPIENNLPKNIDMRAIMDREQRISSREITIQSLESFQKKPEQQGAFSVEGRLVNPYGDPYGFRGIKNPSYQDARIPIYVSPSHRRTLWDY